MVGNSMKPTLSEPMILETFRSEKYNQGDVVVFKDQSMKTIVHRIVKLTESGFITRGDNNLTDDAPIVQQDILGKVIAAYRGDKQYRVKNGKSGFRAHRYLQVRKSTLRYPLRLLAVFYHLLSGSGFFGYFLPSKYKPRIVQYQNNQAQLYLGKLLVGKYDVRLQRWMISTPWRIFINEKSLAKSNQAISGSKKEIIQNISRILDQETTLPPVLSSETWNEVFEFAEKQGIAGYLYFVLKQKKSEASIPSKYQDKIRLQLMQFSIGNLKHLKELEELSLAFESIGKPVIFLKGSHLAFHVYPSPSLRPMGDIDIVVSENNLQKVIGVLKDNGYESEYFDLENAKKYHWHFPPFNKAGKKSIELHWTLIVSKVHNPKAGESMNWLFGETEEKKFGKGTALVFKPDALLFQLMLNCGLSDNFRPSLKNLLDLTVVIQKYQNEIDWKAVSDKILLTNFVKRFALVAWLAKNTVAANIPDQFFQALNAEPDEEMKEIALNRMIHFRDVDEISSWPGIQKANLFKKLLIMLNIVFISPERMRYEYHLKSNFTAILYYPKRIIDVIRKYNAELLKTLHPKKELIAKSKGISNMKAWLDDEDNYR
jgi:signal peptidase I